MTLIIDAILTGLMAGGVYALMATGMTLIFGVLEIINIAQGILVVMGAYLSYTVSQRLHLDLFVGLFITLPVMFVIGIAIEKLSEKGLSSQTFCHSACRCDIDPGFFRLTALFIVFAQASILTQPRERSFDNPVTLPPKVVCCL